MNRLFTITIIIMIGVLALALVFGSTGFDLTPDIIFSIRAPRVFTALFAGAATGVAGALSQSLFRNALATPSITGTESGAAFALALATLINYQINPESSLLHPFIFTFLGAGGATAIAMTFARATMDGRGGLGRLLLGGFALNALLAAGTAFCISILMENGDGMSLYHWLMGSFSARTWPQAWTMAVGFIVCTLSAMKMAPLIDALSLGDDSAKSIGINIAKSRTNILVLIAILSGLSLSVGGALPFIGLIAPHFARLTTRPHLKTLIPLSAIIGAILTVSADIVARTARAPVDMDVGILTTIIGAPYFLWLIYREENT